MILRGISAVYTALVLLSSTVHGFTTTKPIHYQSLARRNDPRVSSSTSLHAVEFLDHAESIHQLIATTSVWLADDASAAAAIVVDAAGKEDLGWWGDYVDLFKNALALVHDTIEGPLRSIGVEQGIWGISIGIFTACTLLLLSRCIFVFVATSSCCSFFSPIP
jgi:hypothetical protein